jgi:thymidylate kinase
MNIKKVIAFEGVSAVGKTTTMHLVGDALREMGHEVGIIDEKNIIRDTISQFHSNNLWVSSLPPITESFLYSAAYAFKIEVEIENAKEPIVMTDRYYHSPIVCQYARIKEYGVSLSEVVNTITSPFGLQLREPDLTLVFTGDIDNIMDRFYSREKRSMLPDEKKSIEEGILVYHKLENYFPNYVMVNADGDIEQNVNKALDKIKQMEIIK